MANFIVAYPRYAYQKILTDCMGDSNGHALFPQAIGRLSAICV